MRLLIDLSPYVGFALFCISATVLVLVLSWESRRRHDYRGLLRRLDAVWIERAVDEVEAILLTKHEDFGSVVRQAARYIGNGQFEAAIDGLNVLLRDSALPLAALQCTLWSLGLAYQLSGQAQTAAYYEGRARQLQPLTGRSFRLAPISRRVF